VADAEPMIWSPATETASKVLVVVAHPDDVDFGSAGTVATLTRAGVEVVYCLVTNGDAGSSDRTHTPEFLTETRQREQRAAAAHVGVSELHFLGFPDGQVEPTLALRKEISRIIRLVRPDRVITQSPERNWDRIYASHPDHLAAGEATIRAVYPDARNHHAYPELLAIGLEPHTVPEVWIMGPAERSSIYVDTTDAFEAKLAALRSHESQVGDGDHLEELLRTWGAGLAAQAGLGAGRLAEAYRKVATA
jgi:LmbE family N-acetylglucosaminyl deacetylase